MAKDDFSKRWVREIAEGMIREGVTIPFKAFARADSFSDTPEDEELIATLKRATSNCTSTTPRTHIAQQRMCRILVSENAIDLIRTSSSLTPWAAPPVERREQVGYKLFKSISLLVGVPDSCASRTVS